MDNTELNIIKEINEVEASKIKFFFVGAIIGALPYLLLLAALSNHLGERILFRNTLIIFTFLSILVNGIIISRTIYKRYKDFMEFKYDTKYDELKKYFN
jgi:hypothetical protein